MRRARVDLNPSGSQAKVVRRWCTRGHGPCLPMLVRCRLRGRLFGVGKVEEVDEAEATRGAELAERRGMAQSPGHGAVAGPCTCADIDVLITTPLGPTRSAFARRGVRLHETFDKRLRANKIPAHRNTDYAASRQSG